ncbi:MAG: hypothetical protein PX635_00875 [Nostocales cyanobacterium LE14-WE12]|nr:hypothetical protein [Nostocales cyanobacterium LE14-WE12]
MTLEDKILEFIAYRKAIKKPIREVSMEAFKKKLIKLGNSNEETMIEILEQSIANGWQGIFELKNVNNKPKFMEKVVEKQNNLTELFNQIDQKYGISKD